MRDYSKWPAGTWTDHRGRVWPIIQTRRRLKFKYPAHAALREYIFNRDGFKCVRCHASAINVPANYDGTHTLWTDKFTCGRSDILVVDHILTLRAGGKNAIENFQALCETCNKRKQREDKAAFLAMESHQ